MDDEFVILLNGEVAVMDVHPDCDYKTEHIYTRDEAEAWIAANPTKAPHFCTIESARDYFAASYWD